jgi:DnaK suppressor protein
MISFFKNMLSGQKIEFFKKELEKEKTQLEKDLERVGKKNLNVPGDWEVKANDLVTETADPSDLADALEELTTRAAIEDKLEERLILVNQALRRIKRGTFGICSVCKKGIEEKRLRANPLARTCIKHAK